MAVTENDPDTPKGPGATTSQKDWILGNPIKDDMALVFRGSGNSPDMLPALKTAEAKTGSKNIG